MTTISAKVVADSVSPDGVRLTTIEARYPRFIHAELMTHRVFSRNARSSRAVPVATMLKEIENDPVVPLFWGKNQKGMQANEEHDAEVSFRGAQEIPEAYPDPSQLGDAFVCIHTVSKEQAWLVARDHALVMAKSFNDAGYHKQVVNRLLEPFMHIDVLITATEWSNFFALRDHPDAEPHIQMLAREIREAMDGSTPALLEPEEWHLPYIDDETVEQVWERVAGGGGAGPRECQEVEKACIKISVARCARISYAPFDGDGSIEKEIERHDALVGSVPMHASPAEHQATPGYTFPSNLRGWVQYRKLLPGECQ